MGNCSESLQHLHETCFNTAIVFTAILMEGILKEIDCTEKERNSLERKKGG